MSLADVVVCGRCDQPYHIGDWPLCPHGPVRENRPAVHETERTIKYYHPEHGWRTPGRSDYPMPENLRKLGFKTVEFPTIRALEAHARETGSRAEILDHDPGSGSAEKLYNDTYARNP
jgi:hypothetical protein